MTAAARSSGVEVAGLGEHRLRNLVEPVRLFEIRLEPADHCKAVDPVCRMRIDPGYALGTLVHGGRRFWFCSLARAGAFAADRASYLTSVEH